MIQCTRVLLVVHSGGARGKMMKKLFVEDLLPLLPDSRLTVCVLAIWHSDNAELFCMSLCTCLCVCVCEFQTNSALLNPCLDASIAVAGCLLPSWRMISNTFDLLFAQSGQPDRPMPLFFPPTKRLRCRSYQSFAALLPVGDLSEPRSTSSETS